MREMGEERKKERGWREEGGRGGCLFVKTGP